MTNWKKITKKQFNDAYNKHLPNKWIKFGYKYFSTETEKKNMKLNDFIIYFLILLFIIGFSLTVINKSKFLIGMVTITYSVILLLLFSYLFSVVLLNNLRIKKIANELNITIEEYNLLIDKFY